MESSTTLSRTTLRLATTAGGLAVLATVLGGGPASARESVAAPPPITDDQVPISDNPVVGAVQEVLVGGPPGPVDLYNPLANPGSGNSTGAEGQLLKGLLGTAVGGLAPEPPACTDNVCGTSPSDLVGE